MNDCDLFLGPEGGFSHAAAAIRKKAIVYFGGWIHPKVTGYDFHENIYFDHSESPCGVVGYDCVHCDEARQNITVDNLFSKVTSILDN